MQDTYYKDKKGQKKNHILQLLHLEAIQLAWYESEIQQDCKLKSIHL
jgi:hypothetical protein